MIVLIISIILHLLFIASKGCFLSTEFTLYPYLVSRGFLPYRDIIDQHFPAIFFGPFSLPYFLTDNPTKLLLLFLSTLAINDILLYRFLVRSKSPHSRLMLLTYILVSLYFSGHILWIEVFVNLFLLIWLNFRDNKIQQLISGFLLFQILLIRPTFFPALIFLFFYFDKLSTYYVLGGIISLLLPAFYLQTHHLWIDFYNLAFVFNSQVYPQGARLLPSIKETLTVSLLLFVSLFSAKKAFLNLALAFSLVLAYPRFGFEHLQPFVLITVLVLSQVKNKAVVICLILIFVILNLISLSRHRYGNYFYSPELYQISNKIKSLPGETVYLLGVSDLIYSISRKVPPNQYYLPSLPWYLNDLDFQQGLFNSLLYPNSLVLLDANYMVDGKTLPQSSPAIINFIQNRFNLIEEFSHYRLYQIKP